jgi:hypothetical protein
MLRKGAQYLLGIDFPGQCGTTQLLEGFGFWGTLFQPGLIDRTLRLGAAAFGVDHYPAWGNAAAVGSEGLIAIPLHQREHGLRVGVGQRVWCCSQSGRDAGAQLEARLGERLEGLYTIQGTVCDEVGNAVRGLQVGHVVGNHLPDIARIAGMATAWLHQHGDARLVFHDPVEHHLIEVRAMISAVALGDMDDMGVWLLPTVGAAINMQARAIQMDNAGCSPEALGSGGRHERREFCTSVGVEGIQGAPQRVIMEVRGVNPGGNEPLGWCVLKNHGHEITLLVHKPQSVEHHGVDGIAKGHDPLLNVLLSRSVNDLPHAKFVKHPSDEAEMIQALTVG